MKTIHPLALGLVAAASLASGCELFARYGLGTPPPYAVNPLTEYTLKPN